MFLHGLRRCLNNMKNILNKLFMVLKFVLFIAAFSMCLYIVLTMYRRIDKDIINSIPIFAPYVILLLLFFINVSVGQKNVNKNIFYNLTCCLVFVCICLVCARSMFDKNMLLNEIMGYGINFSYFSDFIPFMKIMLYGLSISNICFMFHEKESEELKIAKKISSM